ncbi:MAG: single-stranded DNA-binding protein [Spirochaetia bacterium]|nr:single-stranded DNA-binding protein [Spirochaetia bacterium]MDD7269879.1 single-stranded DNA-binding protein [Treponema sp.]MDY4986059.1 single-stranded DNA-binding protein [Treponema sp.]
MTDLNHVVLIGRLTRDLGADERSFGYVGNGQARANVSIAVNRSRKNGEQWIEEANYFDVTIWGKTAENLKPYLTKGKMIAVDGYLKQDRWEKDGQKMSKVSIVATNVQLLGGRDGGSGAAPSNGAPAFQQFNSAPQNNYQNSYTPDSYGDTGNDFPEDIPF